MNDNQIRFTVDNGSKEVLRFESNGEIYVHEKLVENDKEVVAAIREFLHSSSKGQAIEEPEITAADTTDAGPDPDQPEENEDENKKSS